MKKNIKNASVPAGDSEMCYVSFGSGSKAFIILPGLSDGLATVRGKAVLLSKPYRPFFEEYTVYMFSRKDEMPDGYSIRDMAADQAEAMRTLGIGKACVMGVSQGGMIAQYIAIDNPDMVDKLVIAVSAPCADSMIKENVDGWIGMAEKRDHKRLMIDTAEKSYSEEALKKYRKIYPVIGMIGRPKSYRRFMVNAKAILGFDASGELDKIKCPTLIIGGSDDKIVGPKASYDLNERISGSELYIYEGLGHALYEEAADFNDRVLSFLNA